MKIIKFIVLLICFLALYGFAGTMDYDDKYQTKQTSQSRQTNTLRSQK